MTLEVPVLWISRHPEILARGYADQGLLEALFARTLWTPPGTLTFTHHEVRRDDWPDVAGAIVLLPARHHASPDDVAWFKTNLDRLDWSLVLLCGDEEWSFPVDEIPETPTRRTWIMQPTPAHENRSWLIPGGWYPGTDVAFARESQRAHERPLDWMFAGQRTHIRREECVAALRPLQSGRTLLHETDGYMRGMPQSEYFSLLAGAKVVPSPSGPCTVDTARALEALEAGAVPVCDLVRPGPDQFDYWNLTFPGHPFPTIERWNEFGETLVRELADWPHNSNRCFAYWQSWKRATAHKLDDDVRAVAGFPRALPTPDDQITVLISSSPIPSHPSTDILEHTIESVREQLPHAEVLIGLDGVRPEQAHRADDYAEYVRRVLWLANNRWRNVLPILAGSWLHQANLTRRLLDHVTTPLILFVEHDCPVRGPIDWPAICDATSRGVLNVVRLHHEAEIFHEHRDLMLDYEPQQSGGLRYWRTSAFWQRPHVARADFYRHRIMPIFAHEARSMIEDVVYGILRTDVHVRGEAAWWDWRVGIYQPPDGQSMQTSYHLDGRDTDEKYDMRFLYEGEPPIGAPRATA